MKRKLPKIPKAVAKKPAKKAPVRKKGLWTQVTEAAASLDGKRFNLLVAASLVSTATIVAVSLSNPVAASPLAALLNSGLAANEAPVEPEATPEPSGPAVAGESAGSAEPAFTSEAPISSEPLPEAAPEERPQEEEPTLPATPTETLPEAGPIKHVTVLNLVSPGYEAAFGEGTSQMPYLNEELRPQGELLSGYTLLDEDSVPNDLAAVAGQKPNANTKAGCVKFADCLLPFETATIADQLTIGKFTWRADLEGMVDPATGKPDNCVYPLGDEGVPPAEGGYTPVRNPFVYFHSLLDLGDCAIYDLPLTEIEKDLKKADTTPNVAFVTPTVCNAGSTAECPAGQVGGPAAADAFLKQWVPRILASPAHKKDGLLIIAFNQVDPPPPVDPTAPAPAPSRKVGALMLSRFLSPGATDAKAYDPYSLLRSLEDMFGLTHLGEADAAKVKAFASTSLLREGTGD